MNNYFSKNKILYLYFKTKKMMNIFKPLIAAVFSCVPLLAISQNFDFSAFKTEGCTPFEVTFYNTTDEEYRADYNYEWVVEPSKFSVEQDTVKNTYIKPGKYTVTMKALDAEGNVVASIKKDNFITAFKDPVEVITSDKTSDCIYKDFQFSISSMESDAPIVSYAWILSDGTSYVSETPFPHSFSYAGTHDIFVRVEDANGCTNRERKKIQVTTIDEIPNIDLRVSQPQIVCEPTLTVNFENASNDPNIVSHSWEFGDGNTSNQAKTSHTYTQFGIYQAQLTVVSKNGCENSSFTRIQLLDFDPEIIIEDAMGKEITNNNKACPGGLQFSVKNKGATNVQITGYTWSLFATDTTQSLANTMLSSITKGGKYIIKLEAKTAACSKTIERLFSVEEPLEITVSPTNDFYCSIPASVPFQASANVPNTKFDWEIRFVENDSIISTEQNKSNFTSELTNEGFYSTHVLATTANSCTAREIANKNIEVTVPKAIITATGAVKGCVPLDFSITETIVYNTTRDSIKTIEWNFDAGEGYSDQGYGPRSYTYTRRGDYVPFARFTTHKGCQIVEKFNNILPVLAGHEASGYLLFPDSVTCASAPLNFNYVNSIDSLMNSGYDQITAVFTNIKTPDDKIFANTLATEPQLEAWFREVPIDEYFEVSLMLSDHGCVNSFSPSIDSSRCTIESSGGVDIEVCPQTKIYVKGPSIEAKSSAPNCSTPYFRTFTITDAFKLDLNNPGETVEWYIDKTHLSAIDFSPVRKNPVKIDENTMSIDVDFNKPGYGRGTYVISVYAYNENEICADGNPCNCIDSAHIEVNIIAIKADFKPSKQVACVADSVMLSLTHLAKDVEEAYWIDPEDPTRHELFYTSYNINEPKYYTITNRGVNEILIKAVDAYGCEDWQTLTVKTYQPDANFQADVTEDCVPFTTQLTDISVQDTAIAQRAWYLNNKLLPELTGSIVSLEIIEEGWQTPALVITDVLGCKSQKERIHYMKPVVPNSKFIPAYPNVCLGHPALFVRDTNNPQLDNKIHKFEWKFGDDIPYNGDLLDSTWHDYPKESEEVYQVQLTAYSWSPLGNECMSVTTGTVQIKDLKPTIEITQSDKCKEPGQKFLVFVDKTKYAKFGTVEWYKKDGEDRKFLSNDKERFQVVTFDNYGTQSLILKTTSDYYGCLSDSIAVDIEVPGYEADFITDKKEVCVREEINYTLTKNINIDSYQSYWEFGDGISDHTNIDHTTHKYEAIPTDYDGRYKIQFVVNAPNCKPREIYNYITVFPIIAEFDRGLNDADSIGCTPLTVEFINKSKGLSSTNFTWDFGDGTTSNEQNPVHTFANPDELYNVSLSLAHDVCNDKNTKPIHTKPNPHVLFAAERAMCYGDSIEIKATGNFKTIAWQQAKVFNAPTKAHTYFKGTESQYVYAHLVTEFGCKATDSLFLYVQQPPHYAGAPDSALLFYKMPDVLEPVRNKDGKLIVGTLYNANNHAVEGVRYLWTPSDYLSCDNCPSPNIDVRCGKNSLTDCIDFPESVSYNVYMGDTLGCFELDTTITFRIIIDTKAALPQAFTPNADGDNDIAYVRGWGIKEFLELRIYNRWGQLVFESNDINHGWDGTYKGKPQAMDTYSYTIKIITADDKEEFIKGYITLLR